MSILLQNGTLVLPDGPRKGDLRVEKGVITAIADRLPPQDSQVIDCAGKLVFPGFIDTHTHFEMNKGLPNQTADDWATGTRSALCGGTTTVLDFAEPARGASLQSALDTWHGRADGRACCNYSFHMTIKDWNDAIRAELPRMTAQGITSYKIYLAYAMRVSDTVAYEAIRAIGREGGVVGCHCENGELVDEGIAAQKAAGRLGPDAHPDARPPAVEAEAVNRYLTIAELAGVPVNIVHLSTLRGLEVVRAARARGQKLYVETCPQYLMLDDSVYHLPGFESAKYVFAPPPPNPRKQGGPLAGGGRRRRGHHRHRPLLLLHRHQGPGPGGLLQDPQRDARGGGPCAPPLYLRRSRGPDLPLPHDRASLLQPRQALRDVPPKGVPGSGFRRRYCNL